MDVAGLRRLLSPEGQALLASLPPYDESAALGLGERLRGTHDADLVAAALTQSRLRARAVTKFGERATTLLFTPAGLEQATRWIVAEHHAARYATADVRHVVDLCCGIGTDALALAEHGIAVSAVDADPLTAAVAAANLAPYPTAHATCADAADTDLDGADGAFLDPARRSARGRTFDPEAYSPPFSFVLDVARRIPATGAKVAPGIPHDLPPAGAETQWVSVGGDVVEAGIWFGPLARPGVTRSALLLAGTQAAEVSDRDGGGAAPTGALGGWIYEPDGAVVRAGLVEAVTRQVDGHLLDPSIAYVTADRWVPTPFARAYEVLDALPFQLKRLREAVRALDARDVVVKKRGSALEPETLRRQLRARGAGPVVTVVLGRIAGEPWAFLTRPHTAAPTG